MPSKPTQQAEVVQTDQVAMLNAFVELVGERYGYVVARKLTQKDMNEKTATEAKTTRDISKKISESVEKLIKKPSQDLAKTIVESREQLTEARKVLKTAREPFNVKIAPLASAIKYCDSVAIPDSLKELGHTVVPRLSLSDWAKKAIEQTKKQKA